MAESNSKKIGASVNFDPEVLAYLDDLCKRLSCSRSWLINTLVRRHRQLAQENPSTARLPDPSSEVLRV